jgi:CRISPR-associated protein Csx10
MTPPEQLQNNGVFDTLIDRFCAEVHGLLYDPSCPEDGKRVEPFGGFYEIVGGKYKTRSVPKRLLNRVGINRRRATSEDEILYTLEVIDNARKLDQGYEPCVFQGKIILEDESLAVRLSGFINRNCDRIRLGGSTSRGLGKVKLDAQVTDFVNTIKLDIDKFNKKLRKRWEQWSKDFYKQEFIERTYFTINLQSEGIFVDNWKKTFGLTPTMLCEFANLKEESSLQLHTAYSSYDYLSGWNAAWGLMKDVELVTSRGSVFLFSTKQKDLWIPRLETLVQRGIGERTAEGFGQIKICDPFHLIFREEAV